MSSEGIGAHGDTSPDGSQASSATNFYPNILRLLMFEQGCLVKASLWMIVIGSALTALATTSHGTASIIEYVLGIPLILLGIAIAGLLWFGGHNMREGFKNGLLTAAIVEDPTLMTVIHIAAITTSSHHERRYGILRKKYSKLPTKPISKGTHLPCVSVFDDSVKHPNTWHAFQPTLVAFGTGDPKKITRCLHSIENSEDGDYFATLNAFLSRHKVPDDYNQMVVCDAAGHLLETREIRVFNTTD